MYMGTLNTATNVKPGMDIHSLDSIKTFGLDYTRRHVLLLDFVWEDSSRS